MRVEIVRNEASGSHDLTSNWKYVPPCMLKKQTLEQVDQARSLNGSEDWTANGKGQLNKNSKNYVAHDLEDEIQWTGNSYVYNNDVQFENWIFDENIFDENDMYISEV